MNDIKLWQMQVIPGQPDVNLKRALEMIQKTPRWWLVVLPEMAIPGYFIGDEWLKDDYIRECREMNKDIISASKIYGVTVVWGNIDYDTTKKNNDSSTRKYNTAYIASNGKLLKKQYKTLLPDYRMFNDPRYFKSLKDFSEEENIELEELYKPVEVIIGWVKKKVSLLVCEDIWNINGDYPIDPIKLTKRHKPDLIAVPSSSPFWIDKATFRDKLLKIQSEDTTIAYVNPIWIQNTGKNYHVFDGGSAIYKDGKFIKQIENFSEDKELRELQEKQEIEQIYEALIYGIREFFKSIQKEKAVIWLSWWLDSGVVAALITIALWKENITALNMPSKFNSKTTKWLAKQEAEALWIKYKIFPIQEAVDLRIKELTRINGRPHTDFEIENIQARERGKILSDYSASINAIHTNNGNKDELLTGYATLYWDTNGAIAIIGDLHKEQVKALAIYINKKFRKELIPEKTIYMKPSAELSSKQDVDKWLWDPFNYEFLWKMNKYLIEKKKTLTDILKAYSEGKLEKELWLKNFITSYFKTPEEFIEEIEKIGKLKKYSYFKRVQAPPVIQVSKASVWNDYRESQNRIFLWRGYYKLKGKILKYGMEMTSVIPDMSEERYKQLLNAILKKLGILEKSKQDILWITWIVNYEDDDIRERIMVLFDIFLLLNRLYGRDNIKEYIGKKNFRLGNDSILNLLKNGEFKTVEAFLLEITGWGVLRNRVYKMKKF